MAWIKEAPSSARGSAPRTQQLGNRVRLRELQTVAPQLDAARAEGAGGDIRRRLEIHGLAAQLGCQQGLERLRVSGPADQLHFWCAPGAGVAWDQTVLAVPISRR
jgi:hypothetical protein